MSHFSYKWEVPLTYTTEKAPGKMEPITWMEKGSGKTLQLIILLWRKGTLFK